MFKIMLSRFLVLTMIMLAATAHATHNRAGEITYKYLGGLEYEVTITTYTKASSTQADRCFLDLFFGDGTSKQVYRSNGNFDPQRNCNVGVNLGNDVQLNEYTTTHRYESAGQYELTMEDPNRNGGVQNIPNSIDVQFALKSTIFVYNSGTPNSSPKLTIPPVDEGCLGRIYQHNPGAVDQDLEINGTSDSFHYELAVSLADSALPIPNFEWPDQIVPGANNQLSIDNVTGTLTWNAPRRSGEYNVAMTIEEYREINGRMRIVGRVLRDIQIFIDDCAQDPPVISPVNDTCVTAGEQLTKEILARTVNQGFQIKGNAFGDPFQVAGQRASFQPTYNNDRSEMNGIFRWNTECRHIRLNPYNVVVRVQDENPAGAFSPKLSSYTTWKTQVVAPPPEDEIAEPEGNGIRINWNYPVCDNHIGYRVYRRTDSTGYEAPDCITGVPATTGYDFIGAVNSKDVTTYYDDENGDGLKNGIKYCYMITAVYEDGSESYPTSEVCSQLRRDVPIITRVSVNNTDEFNGSDTVMWSPPLELDLTQFTGPYAYRVFRRVAIGDFSLIHTTATEADILDLDTVFVDEDLNTRDNRHTYRIELMNNGEPLNLSTEASSPFLEGRGLDNRVVLKINKNVPWINNQYVFYRQNLNTGNFEVLDTVAEPTYTDTGLKNLQERCYKVLTIGEYTIDKILTPLYNFSQEVCVMPVDSQPPCPPPAPVVDSECELFQNEITWQNPSNLCDTVDDVVAYNLYFKPFKNEGEFEIIEQFDNGEDTTVFYSNMKSVAGCYAVTAIDSFNNESFLSESSCVDNCPEYELPNVITPGGDGYNDFFKPFPYRYVDRIDLKMFNRWGKLVFESEDPDIMWDGRLMGEGDFVPAGTYFYTCEVYEISLEGIIPRTLKGNLTIMYQDRKYPQE